MPNEFDTTTDTDLAAMERNTKAESLKSDPQWRELVKPIFLKMYREGIATMTLVKDGGMCHATFTLDEDHAHTDRGDADAM